MYLIFVNSLEKKMNNGKQQAKVSIHEEQGKWSVLWTMPNPDGSQSVDCWYEGSSWSDLLGSFKYGIAQRLTEGFVPMVQDFSFHSEKTELQQRALMLEYYSDTHMNELLYKTLKEWRLNRSKSEKKAPYLIATNRMLKIVSTFIPQTREELMQIPGFGKQRSMQLGQDICALTVNLERTTSFPLDWVSGQIDSEAFHTWTLKQREERAKRERDTDQRRKEILTAMAAEKTFREICEAIGMNLRDGAQMIEDLDRDGYELKGWIDLQWDIIPDESLNKQMMLEGFEELSDRFLKPVLLRQFTEKELTSKNQDELYAWLRIIRLYYRQSLNDAKAA